MMSESAQDGTRRLRETAGTARQEASATAGQARQAASQVAGTASEQAQAVVGEARHQAGAVIDELRTRVVGKAEEQARRATEVLRQWATDIAGLAENAPGDSPARSVAAQVAQRGHRAADYLDSQGVDGVLGDLRGFARRRPGAFLGGALLAGLAVGRLTKAASRTRHASPSGRPALDGDTARVGAGHEAATPTLPPGPVHEAAPPMPPVPPAVPQSAQPSTTPRVPTAPAAPPPAGGPIRPYPEV